jgi:hypothetical protein
VASIISTNGSWTITADGTMSAVKVEAKDVSAERYSVKADAESKERVVGVAHLKPGYTSTLVQNPNIKPDSIIVITFEGNPGSSWWIGEKVLGQFALNLAAPAIGDTPFTYWIVPVDGVLDVTDSATATEETITPVDRIPTPEPTDSGSSTEAAISPNANSTEPATNTPTIQPHVTEKTTLKPVSNVKKLPAKTEPSVAKTTDTLSTPSLAPKSDTIEGLNRKVPAFGIQTKFPVSAEPKKAIEPSKETTHTPSTPVTSPLPKQAPTVEPTPASKAEEPAPVTVPKASSAS